MSAISEFRVEYDALQASMQEVLTMIEELDIISLEKATPVYVYDLKFFISKLNKNKIDIDDINKLKKLQETHRDLTKFLIQQRDEIQDNLKHLHKGKKMQNTYPRLA